LTYRNQCQKLEKKQRADEEMNQKKNQHQEAAALSKAKIVHASRTLFLTSGFSGTSISAIAKEAGVPQSLLYHYFKNKEELWRHVKAEIIASSPSLARAAPVESLDELLDALILKRFDLHKANPDLVRLLMWQAIEDTSVTLSGTSSSWQQEWRETIEKLQTNGHITQKYRAEEIMMLLNSIVWAPFLTSSQTELATNGAPFCKKMRDMIKDNLKP
jgi:AcrR family transcriptional regulator